MIIHLDSLRQRTVSALTLCRQLVDRLGTMIVGAHPDLSAIRKQDSIHGGAGSCTEGHGEGNGGTARLRLIEHRAKRPNFFLLRGPPCVSLLLRVKTLTSLPCFETKVHLVGLSPELTIGASGRSSHC